VPSNSKRKATPTLSECYLTLDNTHQRLTSPLPTPFSYSQAFTSALQRAQTTLDIQLKEIGQEGIPITKDQALNERDYGDLTGLNKDEARKKFGEEQVHIWRRSYDVPPPGGESLELTAKRVLPYYEAKIKPLVLQGKSILVTAHGNSLRAMIKELENMVRSSWAFSRGMRMLTLVLTRSPATKSSRRSSRPVSRSCTRSTRAARSSTRRSSSKRKCRDANILLLLACPSSLRLMSQVMEESVEKGDCQQ
jgi:broad specificity phosphatase PhoE